MPELLLEIFSEEIPARMQQGAARDLERMASERLKAAGLSWDALTTWAGPRRLTLVVEGLPAATPDRSEELKGPKATAPEQALEGFLRKTGLTRDQLTERDGVLYAVMSSKGRRTTDLIPEMVGGIVRAFPWPKSMRWGDGTLRWVRPIKRILCLFAGSVVPFEIDGIQSDAITEGHRFLGKGAPIVVNNFADYRRKLEADFVLLDVADRKLRILEQARAACAARGLTLVDDDGLLDETAGLAEWPTPILGDMDPQFLTLPPEVIRLSMKVHQKYFAVRDPAAEGLASHFVVVANVEASDGGAALAAGNSRVLSARLNDARFFWEEDQKVGFDAWLKKLSGVTFHAKLGTMAERVDRIAALAREIAPAVGADPDEAYQAARLAKADLASGMVGEFPELQGIMGGYYARLIGQNPTLASLRAAVTPHEGEGESPPEPLPPLNGEGLGGGADRGWGKAERDRIADAIRDHYKPQGPNDTVPTAPVTVAVALADKLDTLVGFFAIDEKPTGSKDPYALRRAALGVIRLVLENKVRVSIYDAAGATLFNLSAQRRSEAKFKQMLLEVGGIDAALTSREATDHFLSAEAMPGLYAFGGPTAEVEQLAVVEFILDRFAVALREKGLRQDLVLAATSTRPVQPDLVLIRRRLDALSDFLATDDGANLLAGYKRASNILRAEEKKGPLPTGAVGTGLPNQPEAVMALAMATEMTRSRVDQALDREDFADAMTALAALRAPVDAFFEQVMVNSDVPAERENRLKLLVQVRDVMGKVADFAQIAG